MKELSLNILDISENSIKAGATLTSIRIDEIGNAMTLIICDNGCGMSEEVLKEVCNPFYTTRTTRNVGLGLPLLKLATTQTGGSLNIKSKTATPPDTDNHGTVVTAVFYTNHIDFTPLGDIVSTITTLIQGHPDTDFLFVHTKNKKEVRLDTRELRKILGEVPLNSYEVIKWTEEYLHEQYEGFN